MIVVFEVAISSELFLMTLHTVQARQYSLTPVGIEGTRLNPENGLRTWAWPWLSIRLANKPRIVGSIPMHRSQEFFSVCMSALWSDSLQYIVI